MLNSGWRLSRGKTVASGVRVATCCCQVLLEILAKAGLLRRPARQCAKALGSMAGGAASCAWLAVAAAKHRQARAVDRMEKRMVTNIPVNRWMGLLKNSD